MAEFSIQAIEVHAIQPPPAELRRRAQVRTVEIDSPEEPSYVVKVFLEPMPTPDGLGYELSVGQRQIRSYTAFDGGVYFVLRGSQSLAVFEGQPVRFRRPGSAEYVDTESMFPVPGAGDDEERPPGPSLRVSELPTLRDVIES